MPLSRHFYPLDDVHAALRYAVGRSQPQEAVFWCQELLWSGCASEAVSTLFEAWLWEIGPFRLAWLRSAWKALASDEITEEGIRLAAYQLGTLSAAQRDHSLWQILVLGREGDAPPDRLTRRAPGGMPFTEYKEVYFVRALYQGKARCAWWMAQRLGAGRVWKLLEWYAGSCIAVAHHEAYMMCLTALQEYDQLLGYRSDEYDVVVRCAAVLSLCLSPSQQQESLRPMMEALVPRAAVKLAEWESTYGRIQTRAYSLPTGCLYGVTSRGRSKWSQHNRGQLYDIESALVGCPFWEDAIADYGVIGDTIQWNSDDAKETFYNRYFPDDIPDEWTREEKQKSHGDGVLGPQEKVTLWKYASRFLSLPSRLVWGHQKRALDAVKKWADDGECHPSSIGRAYVPVGNYPLEDAWLAPVHKRRIVVF